MSREWPRELRRTRQRTAVYDALASAERPVTAQELLQRMEQPEGVWLSTVYRALDIFCEHGMVLKTPLIESGVCLYELAQDHHRHYAVCVLCGQVSALENCPMDGFLPRIAEDGFHILGHRLQIYGYCRQCAGDGSHK